MHLVTLLEEMPVQETLDAVAELRGEQLPVGAVVVNADQPPVLTPEQCEAALAGSLDRAGIATAVRAADVVTPRNASSVDVVVDALLDEARDHAERVALAEQERARLAESGVPTVSLPPLAGGIDLGALYELAATLRAAGFGPEPRP